MIDYVSLINSGRDWEHNLGEKLGLDAKSFFGVNLVGKTPDGGCPSMLTIECPGCRAAFLVYAGVNEVANSVYFVTLQGITELTANKTS